MNMQRRQWMKMGLGLGLGSLAHGAWSAPLVWHERAMLGFGTTLWLRAAHTNTAQLDAALDAAVKALQAIDSEMSLFNPDSAVSRLNAKGVLHNPSAHLRAVLAWSAHVSRRSVGAFDISMQPLWKVWAEAQAQHQLPSKRAVMHAQHWGRLVHALHRQGPRLAPWRLAQ